VKHDVAARIAKALAAEASARGIEGDLPVPGIDRTKKPEHGDFATNVAMAVGKRFGVKPQELAAALKARLEGDPTFERIDVAGPGFLNLKLAPAAFHRALSEVLAAGPLYGRAPAASRERVNLEFVSANPTGPMHLAHGRGAVVGDVVGRLLDATGHRVIREYYVNDAGNQIKLLADSVLAKILGRPDPADGYGANQYVVDLAEHAKGKYAELIAKAAAGDERAFTDFSRRLVSYMLDGFPGFPGIRTTLRALGVQFDVWSSEAALHGDGRVERAIDALKEGGWLVERDGALQFETTRLGDDKDRVVYKSDGGHTYFASDIAYHKDKLDRGFDRLIDVWGADHHGYIPRVRAALTALGLPAEKFEVILIQMVSLMKNGEPYRMGKRLGNFITIDEVLEEIDEATGRKGSGRDALRYYFTTRRADAQLEIDVEIAKKQSLDNPVYYVQYGHARLCAILRKAKEECGIDASSGGAEPDLAALVHADELSIVAMLSAYPDMLAEAAKLREPQKIVAYLTSLTQAFQSYYTRLKDQNDTILPRSGERESGAWKTRDDGAFAAKVRARVAWVRAIRDVYGAGLALLGIAAPERLDRPAPPAGAADAATTTPEASEDDAT
jgi:arginyl-tRNA synthetase